MRVSVASGVAVALAVALVEAQSDTKAAHRASPRRGMGRDVFRCDHPREQVNLYVNSAVRFRDIAAEAGADVLIGNHTAYDGNIAKTAALATRRPGDPNPYVIGKEAVSRYLTVAEDCARMELADYRARAKRTAERADNR